MLRLIEESKITNEKLADVPLQTRGSARMCQGALYLK